MVQLRSCLSYLGFNMSINQESPEPRSNTVFTARKKSWNTSISMCRQLFSHHYGNLKVCTKLGVGEPPAHELYVSLT